MSTEENRCYGPMSPILYADTVGLKDLNITVNITKNNCTFTLIHNSSTNENIVNESHSEFSNSYWLHCDCCNAIR